MAGLALIGGIIVFILILLGVNRAIEHFTTNKGK